MAPLILVVDDNPEVTQVVAAMLHTKGYETMLATSGAKALELVAQRLPDLILCDILMPEIDGFQVFRRVRAERQWRAIPFAFLTALGDSSTRYTSSELGVEAFIVKPFTKSELLSVVSGLLRRAQELQSYRESELDSFKSQLLFMFTHELNTPLSVIRMLTDSMRHNLSHMIPERQQEYLDLLSRSAAELNHIIESMLLALQIDSGRAQELFEIWAGLQSLHSILDSVLARAQGKAAERHVAIDYIDDADNLQVWGHEEQLLQIFSRILDNALNFSPKGAAVTVCVKSTSDCASVTFTDQGPGMTAEEITRIFGRLQQINRARQEQQGIGMSLSLVRALVTIHGGDISVESSPGHGSSFTVSLPLAEPAA